MYLSDRRRNPYSLATVNTYLFLKEEEINRLTTALECIRYGLTPRETLGYIGGAKK
nr:V-type ATPase subunit [Dorea sp. AM58-8]